MAYSAADTRLESLLRVVKYRPKCEYFALKTDQNNKRKNSNVLDNGF